MESGISKKPIWRISRDTKQNIALRENYLGPAPLGPHVALEKGQ